jgi:diguanylate cyclase (GGDEF)-like protein
MRILVANDELISRTMLVGMLVEWGYEVVVATNGNEARQLLQEKGAPQLAILDWVIPGMDSGQVCQTLRQQRQGRYAYILLVTEKKDEIIQGLEFGADDCLIKPYDSRELRARLIAARRILELQEGLIAAYETMRCQAMKDFLTGAWNHRTILEILEREMSRAQREASPLGVIMADLDNFKQVNDTLGHLAGDAVLREVVRRMGDALRPYDLIGRYGGEEFLIVVPGGDQETIVKVAERLRQRIGDQPVLNGEQSIQVTASLGVAAYGGSGLGYPHALLHEADMALYCAKNQGRNQVQFVEPRRAVPAFGLG